MTEHSHPRAALRDGELRFASDADRDDARRRGMFYLAYPDGLDVAPGFRLCDQYHRARDGGPDDAYRGFRDQRLAGSVLGYSSAGNDQVERVQLELALWERHLPAELPPVLHQLNQLARAVVHGFFRACDVRPSDVPRITGGMDDDGALQYGIFNNYASHTVAADGFTPHKDSGFITLMVSDEPGLEAFEDGRWVPVDPLPGHITAINGHALEVLTARMARPAMASYHRVRVSAPRDGARDRTSFGVYIGPRFEQDLYQYDEHGALVAVQSFMSFQRQKAVEMGYDFHPALADA